MMTSVPPRRLHRRDPRARAVKMLTLVAATYDFANHVVGLTFDRPIGIASIDVTQFTIDDSDSGNRYRGSGTPTLISPTTVSITMTLVGPISVPNPVLTVGADNGLVALDDAGSWPGVTGKQVPFS